MCHDMLALGGDITVQCNNKVHCIAVQYSKVICMAIGRIISPYLVRLVPGALLLYTDLLYNLVYCKSVYCTVMHCDELH